MKKILICLSFGLCVFKMYSQQANNSIREKSLIDQGSKYCAKLKDGIMVMMDWETVLTTEVVLANGIKVRPNATVVKPDGTLIILEDGECVDEAGNIVPAREVKRMDDLRKASLINPGSDKR
jgi:hypothetical protein